MNDVTIKKQKLKNYLQYTYVGIYARQKYVKKNYFIRNSFNLPMIQSSIDRLYISEFDQHLK